MIEAIPHKELLWAFAVILTIISYIPYTYDVWRGQTKPHAFSRSIWRLLTAIAFVAQLSDGWGPWAWMMGMTSLIILPVVVYAIWKGDRAYHRSDYLFLGLSLGAIGVWMITDTPVRSVIIITIVDFFAFLPTFRKSWSQPHTETVSLYALSGIKMLISIFALENVSIVTSLYPLSLVIANRCFVIYILWRRRVISH